MTRKKLSLRLSFPPKFLSTIGRLAMSSYCEDFGGEGERPSVEPMIGREKKGESAMTKSTPLVILRKFFGLQSGQDLKGFKAEVDALSGEEKRELTELAAVELGVEVDWTSPKSA